MRGALAQVLTPNLRRKAATSTHDALLTLARRRDGALRLVTTNFDRIFERLSARTKLRIPAFAAPLLPIPKNSRWNGIVYLHGLLPERPDEIGLNRLVVTSGDFGLAYLTERWAARFVSELFRNYVVCFVGYRINDPVLRYMMDALAADRLQGAIAKLPEAETRGHRVARLAGRLKAELSFIGIDDLIAADLHEYLARIEKQCGQIHAALQECYIDYSIEEALAD